MIGRLRGLARHSLDRVHTAGWSVALLSLIGFGLRTGGLGFQSLWRDEVDTVRFASQSLMQLLHTFAAPGQNGPLYYLVLRPWLRAVGNTEFGLRFPSVVFGVLAIPLTSRLGRRLAPHKPWVGPLASLLVVTSPYLVWYSQEGRVYSALVFCALLSVERLLAAVQDGGWWRWLQFALITGATFYLHVMAVLMVPALLAVFALAGGARLAKARAGMAASLAALLLPYIPLFVWQWPMLAQPTQSRYAFVPLTEMGASLLSSFCLGVTGGAWWSLAPALVVLGVGLSQARRRAWARTVAALAGWLLLPVLALYLVTLRYPAYAARYLIFVQPALLLLMAIGVVALLERSRALAGGLLAGVLLVNGVGLATQARTPIKADFRSATGYLVEQSRSDELLLFQIPYGRYSYEYYAPRFRETAVVLQAGRYHVYLPWVERGAGPPRWADGLYTNSGMSSGEVAVRMAEQTSGSNVVWLVESEPELWDARGFVRAWLGSHGRLTTTARFVRVTIYRYEMGPR